MCSEILFECILEYQLELKWSGNWQKLLDPNKILVFFLQCYFSIGKNWIGKSTTKRHVLRVALKEQY